ncbi:MAG: DsbA family protein [Anaerolineae bacterium]
MPSQKAKRKTAQPRRDNLPLLIGGGVVAILVVALLVWANFLQSSAPPASVALSTGRIWGKADAPVTIEEYADFQCPICGQEEKQLLQVAPKYFDTGKAKLVFHNFAFIGQESVWAAEAATCAQDQNKFFDYAALVYANQAGENKGAFSKDNLKGFAQQLKLDMTTFNSCLDTDKYLAQVQQESAEATTRGINSTPTLFINGQQYTGALSADQLGQYIDSVKK